MDKLNKILKNVLVFLVVFLAINYIMQSCQSKEEIPLEDAGKMVFETTKNEYSRRQTVGIEIINNTEKNITIANECPAEPFTVYRYEKNEWIVKESSPELDCTLAKDIILQPGQEQIINYTSWNYALFGEMGRFKVEFEAQIGEETELFTSNEFTIVEEGLFKKLWLGIFYRPIYNGLIFIASVLPGHSLGWAIILLTILIRTILLIPSHKAMRSQKRLQEIQPKLEKIKEKHKGDQQKIAMETMAIWKEAKVNPFGSCLPMLLQFPFLIALFYAIKSGLNPDNTYLLYTEYANFGLHDINVIFLGILDLTKINLYVLPLIVGALQFFQMKLSLARKTEKKANTQHEEDEKSGSTKKSKKNEMAMAGQMMTYIMPVIIAVFTASLPAGVGLYWGTSTIYGIFQQIVINKEGPQKKDEPTVKVISPEKSKTD